MTSEERRRPSGGHQGGDGDWDESAADDTGPTRPCDPELLFEVYRLTHPFLAAARKEHGSVPHPGSTGWWGASDDVRLAALLAVSGDHLIYDPDQIAAEKIKQMAIDLSRGHDWRAAAERPSHSSLTAIRAEPGPIRSFDPAAAARWVETGSSEGGCAAS